MNLFTDLSRIILIIIYRTYIAHITLCLYALFSMTCFQRPFGSRTSKRFHHPVLVPIRNGFSVELELLLTLMQTECNMSSWRFLPALLCLQDSHAKLDAWGAAFKAKDVSIPANQTQLSAIF